MDRSNCDPGYATDGIFLYGDDFVPNSCTANFTLFVVVFAILSIWRTAIAIIQFKVWLARERQIKQRSGKTRRRIPVFPIVSILQASALVLYTVLASLNIANAKNGMTGLLLGLFYTPMLVAAVFMIIRLVRLGKRLIPLSKKSMGDTGSNTSDDSALNRVGQADILLKLIFAVGFVVAVLYPVALVIAGPIQPVYATFQVGAGALAVEDLVLCFGGSYQYQRLILAIRSTEYPKAGPEVKGREKISEVVWKMRMQQIIWLACGLFACIMWLLNITRIVLPYYWYTIMHFLVEILFTTISTLSLASRTLRLTRSKPLSTETVGRTPEGVPKTGASVIAMGSLAPFEASANKDLVGGNGSQVHVDDPV